MDLPNRVTLNYMMHFFTLVAAESESNRMASGNIAMVFAPGLLRPENPSTDTNMLQEMRDSEVVLEFMISNYANIFTKGPPKGRKSKKNKSSNDQEESKSVNTQTTKTNAATFDFVLSFFHRFLTLGHKPWRSTLLLMLGTYLRVSKHVKDFKEQQILQMGELLVVNYYALEDEVAMLAENIAFLLVENTDKKDEKLKDVFNFLRPRTKRMIRAEKGAFLMGAEEEDVRADRDRVQARLETHALITVQQVLDGAEDDNEEADNNFHVKMEAHSKSLDVAYKEKKRRLTVLSSHKASISNVSVPLIEEDGSSDEEEEEKEQEEPALTTHSDVSATHLEGVAESSEVSATHSEVSASYGRTASQEEAAAAAFFNSVEEDARTSELKKSDV